MVLNVRGWTLLPAIGLAAVAIVTVACENGEEGGTSSSSSSSSSGTGASSTGAGGVGAGGTGGAGGQAASCPQLGPEVVSLLTDDGVALEADLYTTGTTSGPAAVLLHMIPPSNNRSNYPQTFIDKLLAQGLSVLNVDRRGAGQSEGVALDAYQGPNGKLDAKAGYDFLVAHECAIDPTRIAFVGASNGTTTALDFTIMAGADDGIEPPRALVFLTGGSYTEGQNSISANVALLHALPIQFVYSNTESAWSVQQQAGAPTLWQFDEYDPGDHGTRMFSERPESMDAVAAFLAAAL